MNNKKPMRPLSAEEREARASEQEVRDLYEAISELVRSRESAMLAVQNHRIDLKDTLLSYEWFRCIHRGESDKITKESCEMLKVYTSDLSQAIVELERIDRELHERLNEAGC